MTTINLTTQEKSVLLAKLVDDWEVVERVNYARVCKRGKVGPCLFEMHKNHNFYTVDGDGNPHLMGWAWRVLNWAFDTLTPPLHAETERRYDAICEKVEWWLPPAEAQAAWLDKILELAIEAGMVQ